MMIKDIMLSYMSKKWVFKAGMGLPGSITTWFEKHYMVYVLHQVIRAYYKIIFS